MVVGQVATGHAYDSMNRLTQATGMGFDWDADGNLLYMHDGSDAWNYTYDPEDRLTGIARAQFHHRFRTPLLELKLEEWSPIHSPMFFLYISIHGGRI